jgi:cation diffusion facilitator CzcD-associated flavoprotein CzcO
VMGCKRVLLSEDYYAALTHPTVELVTEPVERLSERGVVTAGGRERPVDAIIYGTGTGEAIRNPDIDAE